jgi:uncharacterized membrane protein
MSNVEVMEERVAHLHSLLDEAALKVGQQRQTIRALTDALQQMLDLVEFAEMSSRDMEPYKFEAIRDGAERDARKALAKATGEA